MQDSLMVWRRAYLRWCDRGSVNERILQTTARPVCRATRAILTVITCFSPNFDTTSHPTKAYHFEHTTIHTFLPDFNQIRVSQAATLKVPPYGQTISLQDQLLPLSYLSVHATFQEASAARPTLISDQQIFRNIPICLSSMSFTTYLITSRTATQTLLTSILPMPLARTDCVSHPICMAQNGRSRHRPMTTLRHIAYTQHRSFTSSSR